MARFYERYGFAILWSLTSILGFALLYWTTVFLAMNGQLPDQVSHLTLHVHGAISSMVAQAVSFIEKRIQWLGALATLATFAFGVVTGIRQAKRQLPRRLMEFMTEQLAPVYDNSEAIVAAVSYRSANAPHKAQLFRKHPLNRALNALGNPFRPRRRRSLDEAVDEVRTYIEVTERRLTYLNDVRAHAQILRGALRSAERTSKGSQQTITTDDRIEADFAAAVRNETAKAAGLELRGLLRARLGNFPGALQDFAALQTHSQEVFCTRGQARALRHAATIQRTQSASDANLTLLRRARRNLNIADRLFEDGRALGADDWCERGHNRECWAL